MNYQKAADVQKLLSDTSQRMLSKRGSAVVDARTNTLFVQDTPSRLEEVRKLIARIDVAVRQVMIEARIVEANEVFNKNLGVRLGLFDASTNRQLNGTSKARDRAEIGNTPQGAGFATGANISCGCHQLEPPGRRPELVQRGILFVLFNNALT
jgi:type IV pilus assembly protein PilQ